LLPQAHTVPSAFSAKVKSLPEAIMGVVKS